MLKILKPDFIFSDERGSLAQLTHCNCNQVNYVYSKAGAVRGGHYHEINRESFYIISGSLEVSVTTGELTFTEVFSAGDMFSLDAGDIHTFKYLLDTMLIVFYDKGVVLPDGSKDIIPDEQKRNK